MAESGLIVETELPFAWSAGPGSPAMIQGSRLLLRVANQLDQHDQEPDKANERVEAKIDLMLHWLGLHLFGTSNCRPARLQLGQDVIAWQADEIPPADVELILELVIHPALTAPLRLPARLLDVHGTVVRAGLVFPDEEFADTRGQWLFRLHRRAIQEARQRSASN